MPRPARVLVLLTALALAMSGRSFAAPAPAPESKSDDGTAMVHEASQDLVRPEHVYAFGERPRADGPVQASVADEEIARWDVGGRGDPAHVSNRPGFHVAPRVVVDVTLRPGELPVRSSSKGVLS